MAIDLEKMRAKLTALENRGEKKDSAFWRPEDGEQTIRIVPTADGDPFKEAPVLVRGEEEKGVRIWGFGKMAYQELLNLVLNPEYGDITDVESGTDLVIKYGKPAGASFPQTTITPRRRSSPLCDDAVGGPERCAELLENIPEFDSLFTRKTSQEIQSMLDEWLAGEDSAGEDVVKYDSTNSATSVDNAFNELMNA